MGFGTNTGMKRKSPTFCQRLAAYLSNLIIFSWTITVPKSVHKNLSTLATQSEDSMSSLVNRLIAMGLHFMNYDEPQKTTTVEAHCHHLIIQMNALVKNLSAEMLKFNQDDFDRLKQASEMKYDELSRHKKL